MKKFAINLDIKLFLFYKKTPAEVISSQDWIYWQAFSFAGMITFQTLLFYMMIFGNSGALFFILCTLIQLFFTFIGPQRILIYIALHEKWMRSWLSVISVICCFFTSFGIYFAQRTDNFSYVIVGLLVSLLSPQITHFYFEPNIYKYGVKYGIPEETKWGDEDE